MENKKIIEVFVETDEDEDSSSSSSSSSNSDSSSSSEDEEEEEEEGEGDGLAPTHQRKLPQQREMGEQQRQMMFFGANGKTGERRGGGKEGEGEREEGMEVLVLEESDGVNDGGLTG